MELDYILTHLPSKFDGCAIDKVNYGNGGSVEKGKTFERMDESSWSDTETGFLYDAEELAGELENLKKEYERTFDEGYIRFYEDWTPYEIDEVEVEIENELDGK